MMYVFTVENTNPDQESKHIISDIQSSETTDTIFSTFIDKICATLKNKSDFIDLKIKCLHNVNVTGGIKLPKETMKEIKMAKDFDDLFVILCCTPYWNWMNIRMLEKMVGDCPPAKELIDQYKRKVYSRKLKDLLLDIPKLKIPRDVYTIVKEKWKRDFNDVTIENVVEHWNEIEEKFNVEEAMLLDSITESCVEICWLLPNDLVEHAISSVANNQSGDQSATDKLFPEVLYLKIGDVVMKDDITGM